MARIVEICSEAHKKISSRLLGPVRPLVTDALILGFCEALGMRFRRRVFDPVSVVLSMIWARLDEHRSLRQVEDGLAVLVPDSFRARRDGSALCQARQRLPNRLLHKLLVHVGACIAKSQASWRGLRVCIVDGSSSTLDNYPALVRVFGRSRNQHGDSRQPLMRWAGLFCAASGAVLDVAFGPYTCSEARLFLVLLLRQGPGRLWIGDAAYCSYVHLALLGQAGSHFLGVRPASRIENRLRKLGKGDELHSWTRPRPEHTAFARFLPNVPETLTVRVLRASLRRKGYRTRSIVLCTTLLDPAAYPAAEVVHCYAQRWNVELDLRAIKVDHGASHLNARKPRTAVHEFYAGLLAFNLVRALAQQTGTPVRKLSHTRVQALLAEAAHQMSAARVQELPSRHRHLLRIAATAVLDQRQRPPEPRALVRDPKRGYPLLLVRRSEWKKGNRSA